MKEFGYEVSKKWDDAWDKVQKHKLILGFVDEQDEVTPRNPVEITFRCLDTCLVHVVYTGIHEDERFHVFGVYDEEKFLEWCESINLTFIDPEPPNPNAIYFSNGTEVKVGDDAKFNDRDNDFGELDCSKGTWVYLGIDGSEFISMALVLVDEIEWDDNRMINVDRVEE